MFFIKYCNSLWLKFPSVVQFALDEIAKPAALHIEMNVGIRIEVEYSVSSGPTSRSECPTQARQIQCKRREPIGAIQHAIAGHPCVIDHRHQAVELALREVVTDPELSGICSHLPASLGRSNEVRQRLLKFNQHDGPRPERLQARASVQALPRFL